LLPLADGIALIDVKKQQSRECITAAALPYLCSRGSGPAALNTTSTKYLLVSVLFDVSFPRLFSMMSGVAGVSACAMCVMGRLFVMTAFVVLCSFLMMLRSMPVVL
jgi:hypothetical protein